MSSKEILEQLDSQRLLFMFGTKNVEEICKNQSKDEILDRLYDVSKRKLYLR